jgi:hypothetical protein
MVVRMAEAGAKGKALQAGTAHHGGRRNAAELLAIEACKGGEGSV